MDRIEIVTNRGTSGIVFEATPGGIVVCNIPLIGTVTVKWESIVLIHQKLREILDEYKLQKKIPAKPKKTKKI